jgi:NAD(P)-dependent dehydrogenase (short-subunit alcohol dehydrogenase family)
VHLNAGISGGEVAIGDLTDEHYRRVLGVNLDGVVFGVRATLPLLRAAEQGAIVVTSSMAGLSPYAPDPVYTITKQAVVGLVRCLSPELALDHITINAVCPGLVDTPMMAAARDLFVAAGLPLLDPAEVAAVVVDLMAGTETGQAIAVLPGERPRPWTFSGPPVLGAELVEIRQATSPTDRG